MTNDIGVHVDLYRRTLRDEAVPFWMRHPPDREYGGCGECEGLRALGSWRLA
jgi:hypothetical protein